jgi:hypothetical protein
MEDCLNFLGVRLRLLYARDVTTSFHCCLVSNVG